MVTTWRMAFAAPNRSGRWHVVKEDRAACDSRIFLNVDEERPVGRVTAVDRCKRQACFKVWPGGLSEETRRRESMQRDNALVGWHEATSPEPSRALISRRAMWEERGWLFTHFVFVVHVPSIKMYRILLSGTLEGVNLAVRGKNELVDLIKVPNRHAAILTKLELLQWVDPWRLELPHSRISKGGTELWRQAGPSVELRSVWAAVKAELLEASPSAGRK